MSKYGVFLNEGYSCMTYGKIYKFLRETEDFTKVKDDKNNELNFFKSRFQEVPFKFTKSRLFKLLW